MSEHQPLREALNDRVLLGDGAMGTQMQAAGLEAGACGESWNLEHPEKVLRIQKAYADAGSDCLITNTFGGSRATLERHGLGEQAYQTNKAAAELARQALGDKGWVLGDVGPFGGFLSPLGTTTPEELHQILSEQIRGLLDGGADAIILETQTAIEEASVGVRAARELNAPCVIASFAFDKGAAGYKTMMGVGPAEIVARMGDLGVDVFGANCGTDLDLPDYIEIAKAYRQVTDQPLMVQPNAGKPQTQDGQVVYLATPEAMAEHLPGLVESGVRIIGGCCGTTPDHLARFREVLDKLNR